MATHMMVKGSPMPYPCESTCSWRRSSSFGLESLFLEGLEGSQGQKIGKDVIIQARLPYFPKLSALLQLPFSPSAGYKLINGGLISFLLASALTSNIPPPSSLDTFQNVPSTISGAEKAQRIQRPNSAKAESCTRKCVGTCIRGGGGAPGEGPLNVRKPLVVFKGFAVVNIA